MKSKIIDVLIIYLRQETQKEKEIICWVLTNIISDPEFSLESVYQYIESLPYLLVNLYKKSNEIVLKKESLYTLACFIKKCKYDHVKALIEERYILDEGLLETMVKIIFSTKNKKNEDEILYTSLYILKQIFTKAK